MVHICITGPSTAYRGHVLVVSVYDNHYLAGAEHSTHTDGQGSLGNLVHVVVKRNGSWQ